MIRFSFLISLIITGLGSSILGVSLPYLLASLEMHNYYFIAMGIIYSLTCVGSFVFGRMLDKSSNIWQSRIVVLGLEVLFTLLLYILTLFNVLENILLFIILIGLLELLLAYEIPWSRLAWNELNNIAETDAKDKDKNSSNKTKSNRSFYNKAFYIVIATTLISSLGPGIGAILGLQISLQTIILIKLISIFPYALLIIYILQNKNYTTKLANLKQTQKESKTPALGSFGKIFQSRYYVLLSLFAISIIVANALLILVLPLQLIHDIKNNVQLIFWFYLVSSLVPIAISSIINRFANEKLFTENFILYFVLIFIVSGAVFIIYQAFIMKFLMYLSFCIANIYINSFLTNKIYDESLRNYQGRLFSLLQIIGYLAYPLLALILLAFNNIESYIFIVLAITALLSFISFKNCKLPTL